MTEISSTISIPDLGLLISFKIAYIPYLGIPISFKLTSRKGESRSPVSRTRARDLGEKDKSHRFWVLLDELNGSS